MWLAHFCASGSIFNDGCCSCLLSSISLDDAHIFAVFCACARGASAPRKIFRYRNIFLLSCFFILPEYQTVTRYINKDRDPLGFLSFVLCSLYGVLNKGSSNAVTHKLQHAPPAQQHTDREHRRERDERARGVFSSLFFSRRRPHCFAHG